MNVLPPMPPSARVTVTILGDEATVELACDAGAELPTGLIALAKETVEVLAEKRLAWWNPIE